VFYVRRKNNLITVPFSKIECKIPFSNFRSPFPVEL